MKKLFYALLFPLACSGATITGYLIDQFGAAKTGTISIRPLSTPSIYNSTQYVSGAQFSITLTNGAFTNTLLTGEYVMLINSRESPRISVPDTTNTYNFIDLINTNGLIYQFKQPGAVVKVSGNDGYFGFLQEKLTNAAPLVLTLSTTDGNELLTLSLPVATASAHGYLSSNDWSTFNSKQAALGTATNNVSGILSSNDWSTFNAKQSALGTATNNVSGILSSNDWQTFNAKQAALGVATNDVSGILSSNDWQTFNAKQSAIVASNMIGATVTFNTTNYLELVVDGVTNKLARINE